MASGRSLSPSRIPSAKKMPKKNVDSFPPKDKNGSHSELGPSKYKDNKIRRTKQQRKQQGKKITIYTDSDKPVRNARKSPRMVSFNKNVRVRRISLLDHMPREDIAATYYSRDELVNMCDELQWQIQILVEQGVGLDEDDEDYRRAETTTTETYRLLLEEHWDYEHEENDSSFCMRGLEHVFPQGKARRQRSKTLSRGVVLEKQKVQRLHQEWKEQNDTDGKGKPREPRQGAVPEEDDFSMVIAEAYRMKAKPALELALLNGARDEFIADRIYSDDAYGDNEEFKSDVYFAPVGSNLCLHLSGDKRWYT
ncbi:unnamed protein product [Pseudo-nitzschia multistriata]|uniref:Uncharacterized protein n=1 Tax=Pseudo-nitzschia multistriata TaxID=183589 RepID=A0A448ZDH8_9STRA|nr:unnamed protein product [Pseudo-nitzschia multistriata]